MILTPEQKDKTLRKQKLDKAQMAKKLLKQTQAILDDDKAVDVTTIDLAGKTPMSDYMIVATGTSHRHVSSMADSLISKLKDEGFGRPRVEGMGQGDWVLVDAGDVIIHLFRLEVREFYNLEKMWTVDFDEAVS